MKHAPPQRLLAAFCSMHRRNRTVSQAYDTPLTTAQATALSEISAKPGIGIQELAQRLHLSQVACTRLVHALTKDRILQVNIAGHDKRARELRFTKEGEKVFHLMEQRAYTTFQSALERVPQKEWKFFLSTFSKFNDGLGAEQAASLAGDAQGMSEIRRITRALGLHKREAFGNKHVSPLEFHLFRLFAERKEGFHAVDLAQKLSSAPKFIHSLIHRFVTKKLLSKEKNKIDARFHVVQLSPRGKVYARKLSDTALALVEQACKALPTQEAKHFAELFELYAGIQIPDNDSVLPAQYFLRNVHNISEKNALRAFLIEERARQKLCFASSDIFAGEAHHIFVVLRDEKPCVYAEFSKHPLQARTCTLIHFLSSLKHEKQDILSALVQKILDQFFHSSDASSLACAEQDCSSSLWKILQKQHDVRLRLLPNSLPYSLTGKPSKRRAGVILR